MFFVINQTKVPTLPPDVITALETEIKAADEENKALTTEIRLATSGQHLSIQVLLLTLTCAHKN